MGLCRTIPLFEFAYSAALVHTLPAQAERGERQAPGGLASLKTADSGFKSQLGRPSGTGQVTFPVVVLGEVFSKGGAGAGLGE